MAINIALGALLVVLALGLLLVIAVLIFAGDNGPL